MGTDYTPSADKLEAELNALERFWRKHPLLSRCLLLVVSLALIWLLLDYSTGKAALNRINNSLAATNRALVKLKEYYREENDRVAKLLNEKDAAISQLETRLAPFTTATILKYGSATEENYRKLAEDVARLEALLVREQKLIKSFTATLKVSLAAIGGTNLQVNGGQTLLGSDDWLKIRKKKERDTANDIFFSSGPAKLSQTAEGLITIDYTSTVPVGRFSSWAVR